MSSYENSGHEADERLKALYTNTNAIKAVAAAVEGTLGPKGLDTMLVDAAGGIVITNDGVTILNKMEANHPAAKMLIQIARSQQTEIGDGTTTATILSSELLSEAVKQVEKGVPIPKVIKGIREGIALTIRLLKEHSRELAAADKNLLHNIAYVSGREHSDIAKLIVEAAKLLGDQKLLDTSFKFADSILAHEGYDNELVAGLILNKKRMNSQLPKLITDAKILVIDDTFEPEDVEDEALGTEIGYSKYLEYKEAFKLNIAKLTELGINLIAVARGVDPLAEEFCIDNGILVIQRLSSNDLKRLVENTKAKAIKRTGINKDSKELQAYLGYAKTVFEDEKLGKTRVIEGAGNPVATILVGASTGEIVEERERIAKDAAASVQSALIGGYLPGGGTIELFVAKEIENYRQQIKGLEGYGYDAVAQALRRPMAQILLNAGFNPIERVEEAKAAQIDKQMDSIGIDTDSGQLIDMEEAGVIDPTLVKIHAVKVAGEITEAILRIHTIIKMKTNDGQF